MPAIRDEPCIFVPMSTSSSWSDRINVLFILGLFLAVGGCNAVFLLEGWLVFGTLVVWLVGLVLVWLSRPGTFHILLAVLLPTVIFVSIYTITRDDRIREPGVYTIPAGYSGPLYIFLKEDCGQAATYEDGYRRYDVDARGYCFSQHTTNYGTNLQPSRFLLATGDGDTVALPNIQVPADTIGKTILRDSTGQPLFAFPGSGNQQRIGETKVYLDYAFVGTYPDYLAFIRSVPLPDTFPKELGPVVQAWRDSCRRVPD